MSKQTCPEQGEHWITDKSGQHMYKCPKCGGAKGHWISDNGWTATWKPCKAGSGFVTDSGTGELCACGHAEVVHSGWLGHCQSCKYTTKPPCTKFAPQPSEAPAHGDTPERATLRHMQQDVKDFVDKTLASEAEGKPVPAPNPPIPDELEQLLQKLSAAAWSMGLQNASPEELKNDRQNSMTVRKAHAAITRLYAGREARAFAQGQIRELTWAAGTHPDNKTMADRLAELLAKEKLL